MSEGGTPTLFSSSDPPSFNGASLGLMSSALGWNNNKNNSVIFLFLESFTI